MKIAEIHIQNFRLLKNFTVDLEDDLSLVIGKNNTGKTSLLTVLDKFLGASDRKFTYDDFNLELREQIVGILEGDLPEEKGYAPLGIKVRIKVEYDDNDNLAEVSQLIMSLDPEDKTITLEFSYELDFESLDKLKTEFGTERDQYNNTCRFLQERLIKHISSVSIRSISSSDENNWVDLLKEKIQIGKIIGFQYVGAKREVTNQSNDQTLSLQTSKIYKKTSESEEHKDAVDQFKSKLRTTDEELSTIYKDLFGDVIGKIKRFGGLKEDDTLINIVSTLQHKELLDGNTTVTYKQAGHDLPEHYNGLGYMNLISMIFEIEILISQLKRANNEAPAPINLLFIEEPEAHTHPQMQYIFIKNIKKLLSENRLLDGGGRLNLQTVISTHSSHIVAESDFDDIKYLRRIGQSSVESRNLKSLKSKYSADAEDEKHFRFLKQYLTLNRSEVFFADKIVMFEGDTERILLPAMMKKIDQEMNNDALPLLSQNISLIEVGAHSKTFDRFIDFLGVKTLIITDIDSGYVEITEDEEGNDVRKQYKCFPNDPKAQFTTNSSLIHFHGKSRDELQYFIDLSEEGKSVSVSAGAWTPDTDGFVFLAYQTPEDGYYARSFEDAFFSVNQGFVTDAGYEKFPSTVKKWFDTYAQDNDHYQFAEKGVTSKPSFAIEILLNSIDDADGNHFSNWHVPHYIKEGLLWLQKD